MPVGSSASLNGARCSASSPHRIPLSATQVRAIAAAVEPFRFDRVYSHFFDRVIETGGKEILRASVARYVAALQGSYEAN